MQLWWSATSLVLFLCFLIFLVTSCIGQLNEENCPFISLSLCEFCWTTSHNTEFTLRRLSVLLTGNLSFFMMSNLTTPFWIKHMQKNTGMSLCHHRNLLLHHSFEKKPPKRPSIKRHLQKVQIYTPALSQRLKIRASAKHSKTKQQR